MLKNYLKIAWRHLMRHKGYTAINTIGLAVGLAVCIIIGLWVHYELSYDTYHEKSDRIYRVLSGSSAATQPPLAPALKEDYPNLIDDFVRFWPIQAPSDIVYKDKVFTEKNITYTDPSIFRVFTHPLLLGDPEKALSAPNSILLSESTAARYFGNENPMGKTMNMWGRDLNVTGVFKDVPINSHHRFDMLVPMKRLRTYMGSMMDNWNWNGFYTYVVPAKNVSPETIQAVLPSLYTKYAGEDFPEARLQPLTDIYFNPQDKDIGVASGNIGYVYTLITIAIFVLVVACVNFMNLSTAYASLRNKEVGIRKTLGARRWQLAGQFLGEAILLSVFATAMAIILVELMLPFFRNFTAKPLVMPYKYAGLATAAGLAGGLALLIALATVSWQSVKAALAYPVESLKK